MNNAGNNSYVSLRGARGCQPSDCQYLFGLKFGLPITLPTRVAKTIGPLLSGIVGKRTPLQVLGLIVVLFAIDVIYAETFVATHKRERDHTMHINLLALSIDNKDDDFVPGRMDELTQNFSRNKPDMRPPWACSSPSSINCADSADV